MAVAKISKVDNKDKKWNENSSYYPLQVELEDGNAVWLMFTHNQLRVAYDRAQRNPEDIPAAEENEQEEKSLLGKLFGWVVD